MTFIGSALAVSTFESCVNIIVRIDTATRHKRLLLFELRRDAVNEGPMGLASKDIWNFP